MSGLLLLCFLQGAAMAAAIDWGTPQPETGNAGDVVTTGTSFDSAAAYQGNVLLNGVTFNGQTAFSGGTMSFGNGSQIQVQNIADSTWHYASAPLTWDPNYQTLVSGGAYANNPPGAQIVLGGLTPGEHYEIQIFESFWDFNWATSFSGGVNSTLLSLGSYQPADHGALPPEAVPEYVTGSFTAGGSSQTILMGGPTPYAIFDAIQVRTLAAVPEPSTMVSGLSALGIVLTSLVARLRRSRVTRIRKQAFNLERPQPIV